MRLLVFIPLIVATITYGQDEGTIVKRERIERNKNIFVGGGISIPGGSNFGDYSTGINFEGGFLKRLNRVISIGASVSYLQFKYDADKITKAPVTGQFPGNFFYSVSSGEGFLINIRDANISLISLSGNIKFNFVPVKDNSVISVYGFAKPFITSSKHSNLTADVDYYTLTNNQWIYDQTIEVPFESPAKITGGVFVGPGIEINPAKPLSIFLQASFGYTFPINIISTSSFKRDIDLLNNPDEFPFISSGFTSINFAAGISFNLD